jgi:hypothetical protein
MVRHTLQPLLSTNCKSIEAGHGLKRPWTHEVLEYAFSHLRSVASPEENMFQIIFVTG